eukprot:812337-Amphidinium_carterae.2
MQQIEGFAPTLVAARKGVHAAMQLPQLGSRSYASLKCLGSFTKPPLVGVDQTLKWAYVEEDEDSPMVFCTLCAAYAQFRWSHFVTSLLGL